VNLTMQVSPSLGHARHRSAESPATQLAAVRADRAGPAAWATYLQRTVGNRATNQLLQRNARIPAVPVQHASFRGPGRMLLQRDDLIGSDTGSAAPMATPMRPGYCVAGPGGCQDIGCSAHPGFGCQPVDPNEPTKGCDCLPTSLPS
jgi:hypothetical protein